MYRKLFRSVFYFIPALLVLPSRSALADNLTSQSLLNEAIAAANHIDDGGLKARTMNLIAAAQAQSGDSASAKQTTDAILVNTYGDPSAAADWARSQQDPFVEASALISVARALRPPTTSSNR